MTVYVVASGYDYEGTSIVAICATEELARRRAQQFMDEDGGVSEWRQEDPGDDIAYWERTFQWLNIQAHTILEELS